MIEAVTVLIDQIYAAPSMVWTIALLMSAISSYMLHTYIDDRVFSVFACLSLFVTILIAHVAFNNLGIYFSSNKDSNVVASAGAAVCSMTMFSILVLRMWNMAADARNRLRGEG